MENPKPSQIHLYWHIFFKCCATWDACKCDGSLSHNDKRYRGVNNEFIKNQLMYNKYQDYQEFKRKCPGIPFGDFISGNILNNKA
jgi:hypothetical protein